MPKISAKLGKCKIDGCDGPHKSKGLCQKHYMRQWYGGTTELKIKGDKRRHKYYSLWFERKTNGILSEEWMDFYQMMADIGERPGADYTLSRLDQDKPFGRGNFEWRPHLRRAQGETMKAWYARKWASRQAANPGSERTRELRRRFGLTVEDYDAMLEKCAGKCSICRQPETAYTARGGSARRLAIDHNHQTGQIRGLLCFRCNSAIGKIDENLDLLDAMRAYLVSYERKDTA